MAASNPGGPRAVSSPVPGPGAAAVLAALGVFLILAFWRAGAPTLWNDEVMSVSFARRSWYALLHGAASDHVHPPLFYAVLKVWIRIGGERPLWLRLLPIATAAPAIPLAGRLCRELRLSRRASVPGLFAIATSGYVVFYAQELRPYALLLLASTLSLLVFVRALAAEGRAGNGWILLALANALLVYAHYYGWLVVGTQALWVLFRERRRLGAFALSCVLPVAAFVPWAWLVSRELKGGAAEGLSGNLAGLEMPGPLALPRFYGGLIGPYRSVAGWPQLVAGVALLVLVLSALVLRKASLSTTAPRSGAAFLAAFAFLPSIVAVLVSVGIRPVFNPRYLVEAAVPFLLLTGAALSALDGSPVRAAAVGAVAAWCLWGVADQLVRPSRIAWGDLIAGMSRGPCAAVPLDAPVYALGRAAPRPVSYYLRRAGVRAPLVPIASLDEVAPGGGRLAFHAGADLEGAAYWAAGDPAAIRAALTAGGRRIVCDELSGPDTRHGELMTFMPAEAAR
jgi:hypothetical protein